MNKCKTNYSLGSTDNQLSGTFVVGNAVTESYTFCQKNALPNAVFRSWSGEGHNRDSEHIVDYQPQCYLFANSPLFLPSGSLLDDHLIAVLGAFWTRLTGTFTLGMPSPDRNGMLVRFGFTTSTAVRVIDSAWRS